MLEKERERLDRAYGDGDTNATVMDTVKSKGSLNEVIAYAVEGMGHG